MGGCRRLDAALHEDLPDPLALRLQFLDLGGERAERPVHVGVELAAGAGVHSERLGELRRHAVVVDRQPVGLLRRGPVDAGDGLEQFGLLDQPVEVEDLGLRHVEPGEEHRLHDEQCKRAVFLVGGPEREPEAVDVLSLAPFVGPGRVVQRVVVLAGDDRGELQGTDEVHLPGGGTQERLLGVGQHIGPANRVVASPVDLGVQFVAGHTQSLVVPQACLPAGGDDHALEAVGHHRGDVVPEDVAGLRRDQLRRFKHLRGGGVPPLERLPLLVAEIGEPPVEEVVHVRGAPDGSVGGAPLVEDLHRRAVGLGLGERVPVEVAAEDLQRPLPLAHDDRRTGEPDPGGVGQGTHQVGVQRRRLRTVRLVDHHQNRLRLVQRPERVRLAQTACIVAVPGGVTPLLDHRHHHTRTVGAQQFPQLGAIAGDLHGLAGERGCTAELVFEVGAVGDQHDLEPPQLEVAPHRPDQEHHGQALARPLGVPDDPAPAVHVAVGCPRLAGEQPPHRLVDAPVLLVAADNLDRAARADLHEQREVPDDVQQPLRRQHPGRQQFLLRDSSGALAEGGGDLVDGGRLRVLPCQVMRAGPSTSPPLPARRWWRR